MKRISVLLGTALLAAACGGGEIGDPLAPEATETAALGLVFETASARWGVPADVLKAVAFAETGFERAGGESEFEGQAPAYGLFALSGDELERAARLAGRSVEEVMRDDEANVHAAAALLASMADEAGLEDRDDVAQWGAIAARLGGVEEELLDDKAADVLGIVHRGAIIPLEDGTNVVVAPHPIEGFSDVEDAGEVDRMMEMDTDEDLDDTLGDDVEQESAVDEAGLDRPIGTQGGGLRAARVRWMPSPNYGSRNGTGVNLVVIHSCEGSYAGCSSWLRNRAAQASAHYVVKEDGRQIAKLVLERNRAWHVAASYRPALNGGRMKWRAGRSVNDFSIGIEHGGFASQRRWPERQIAASVHLVRSITARHDIPRDRYHIVSHGRLQPETRTDPGRGWPWASYISAIRRSRPSRPPRPSIPRPPSRPPQTPPQTQPPAPAPRTVITVDNATPGRFRAPSSWRTASSASGRYGSNYRFHAPEDRSEMAEYKVDLDRAGRYEVLIRVPANGYNTEAPFFVHHEGGRALVHRNLSRSGGKWVSLGTYDFAAKDDWIVQMSVWTAGRGNLIADAVRLERR